MFYFTCDRCFSLHRLVDDGDRAWLIDFIRTTVSKQLGEDFDHLFKHYDDDGDGKVNEDDLRSLMFCDFSNDNRLYMEALDQDQLHKVTTVGCVA